MLSKTSTQVINAFIELAKLPQGQSAGAKSIAKKINAPANYLGKVLQGLCVHGLVVSQRGLGGGFRLGKDPKQIMLYDIVEPIDHVTVWSECAMGLKKCSDNAPCAMHDKWKQVRNTYHKFLKTTSIADLLRK